MLVNNNTTINAEIISYNNLESILNFLNENPIWLSGFVAGEGCFTGYLSLEKNALWGLQPGLDFNITQSSDDRLILNAINIYFKNVGGVYDKPNNISVMSIRNVKALNKVILPFFCKYPLVANKSYQFERWKKLLDIYYNKKHTIRNMEGKNYVINFAEICRELNVRKNSNNKKVARLNIIINWLKNLKSIPTCEDKLYLYKLIEKSRIP
jgi:LAGLIDADG endonuclease